MPRPERFTDAESFIASYNPALGRHHLVSPQEWALIQESVRAAMVPCYPLPPAQVRPLMAAYARLAKWAEPRGFNLNAPTLLRPKLIGSFLAQFDVGTVDPSPYLWRLAQLWHTVTPEESGPTSVARPGYQTPYSPVEIEALIQGARRLRTANRRMAVLAVLVLGAGAGVTRETASSVEARDLHHHGEYLFVATRRSCAMVLPPYDSVLCEVATHFATGSLRGPYSPGMLSARINEWIGDRRGVPAFSVDRLRATYVCELIARKTTLVDVLNWSGVKSLASLDRYVAFVDRGALRCGAARNSENDAE